DESVYDPVRTRATLEPQLVTPRPMLGIGRESGSERISSASSLASASARSPRISSGNASISQRQAFGMTITGHCLTCKTYGPAEGTGVCAPACARWQSGAEGSRTLDLLNAIQALSRLSYGPTRRDGTTWRGSALYGAYRRG